MNLLKGEVPLKAGDKEYTLKFTTDALCQLEDLLDMGINELIISASKNILRIKQVRAMLYCACLQHHKEEMTSLEVAGKIIDVTGFSETWTAVVKAIAACLPDHDKGESAGQKKTSDKGK